MLLRSWPHDQQRSSRLKGGFLLFLKIWFSWHFLRDDFILPKYSRSGNSINRTLWENLPHHKDWLYSNISCLEELRFICLYGWGLYENQYWLVRRCWRSFSFTHQCDSSSRWGKEVKSCWVDCLAIHRVLVSREDQEDEIKRFQWYGWG